MRLTRLGRTRVEACCPVAGAGGRACLSADTFGALRGNTMNVILIRLDAVLAEDDPAFLE